MIIPNRMEHLIITLRHDWNRSLNLWLFSFLRIFGSSQLEMISYNEQNGWNQNDNNELDF